MRIDLIRRIKNLDLVRRVLDPEGEMTAFNKQESWWPNRGRLEKNSDALEIPVKTEQRKVLKLFPDSGN